ncbi:MAG TPA: hypothetical protein VMR34_05130 [Candidatus Saccharimonadales bacterium]|nr:hypothetical protein [Candidatus Saccharimonadales bacterium]
MSLTKKLRILSLFLVTVLMLPVQVWATQTSSSAHYEVTQTTLGAGACATNSNINCSSADYSATATVGDLGIGNTSSADYEAYAGFNTTSQPFLEMVVTTTPTTVTLGTHGYLSSTSTAYTTTSFYVRAWQASGYTVTTVSPPPTSDGGNVMATNGSPHTSTVGVEQFGMNLVQNNSCTSSLSGTIGANISYNSLFAHGTPTGNYDTACDFYYNQGDTIASASSSTSSTVYTISYIFNVQPLTIAGQYTFNQVLVATPTY